MQKSTTESVSEIQEPEERVETASPEPRDATGRRIREELLTGVIMIGIAALFLFKAGSGEMDWLFPIVLSYALIAMGVILVGRGLLGYGQKIALAPRLRGGGTDVLVFGALSIGYVILIPQIGFWIMTGLVITIAATYLDTKRSVRRTALAAGVAALVCVVAYLVLTLVFYIEFPLGLLDG